MPSFWVIRHLLRFSQPFVPDATRNIIFFPFGVLVWDLLEGNSSSWLFKILRCIKINQSNKLHVCIMRWKSSLNGIPPFAHSDTQPAFISASQTYHLVFFFITIINIWRTYNIKLHSNVLSSVKWFNNFLLFSLTSFPNFLHYSGYTTQQCPTWLKIYINWLGGRLLFNVTEEITAS